MKRTGFLYDLRYLLHDTGPYHPEMADRLQVIYEGIEKAGLLPHLTMIAAQPADPQWVEKIHSPAYVQRFEEVCLSGNACFDSEDNRMCRETYETAMLAAGGLLETTRRLMQGEIDNAFCAIRPPGHHAEREEAMGFCYFNNVAIAARYLQEQWKLERIGIIDFDVHHGNGTQHLFEDDPSVFYYSIHEHPSFAFPGTGREFETGIGAGLGYTKNSPMLPGQTDADYRQAIETDLLPAFEWFKPEFILLSSGFDAHKDDDMADMRLTDQAYQWMMRTFMQLADTYAKGRIISVLEGGYNLDRLPELAADHVAILLDIDRNSL
jgi:acetoin utilization deacetylase AcuC-like enzyme